MIFYWFFFVGKKKLCFYFKVSKISNYFDLAKNRSPFNFTVFKDWENLQIVQKLAVIPWTGILLLLQPNFHVVNIIFPFLAHWNQKYMWAILKLSSYLVCKLFTIFHYWLEFPPHFEFSQTDLSYAWVHYNKLIFVFFNEDQLVEWHLQKRCLVFYFNAPI
jgi:hypothetical protein